LHVASYFGLVRRDTFRHCCRHDGREPPSFAYNSAAPLDVIYGAQEQLAQGVICRAFRLVSDSGRFVTGEVCSGLVRFLTGRTFRNWLGDTKTMNHTEFEPDAIAAREAGGNSILVDGSLGRATLVQTCWHFGLIPISQ